MSFAKIRPRRGTASQWATIDPVLVEGEIGIEVPDTGVGTGLVKVKFGDGVKKWSELPYGVIDGLSGDSIVDNLESTATDLALSANQGRELNTSKVGYTDIVDNLLSNRADLPLSANQGRVLSTDVSYLGSKWLTQTTNVKGTVTFTISGSFLLFCEWGGASFYSIYYIRMDSNIVAPISSNSDAWTVTISDNYTKLNISNENGGNQWADYRIFRIS